MQRKWKTGDRIELELPLPMRLEAIDPRHSETVALVSGPLVLFAMTDSQPSLTRAQLLAARKTGPEAWEVASAGGPLRMLPFTAINDEPYTTYLRMG